MSYSVKVRLAGMFHHVNRGGRHLPPKVREGSPRVEFHSVIQV